MKTLIRGGTVVTALETMMAEVLVVDEKVVGLVDADSDLAHSFSEDAYVVDATDRLVVPGGIDVHTHFESEGQNAPVLDTFETGTRASAFGGTTTVIDFAWRATGGSLLDGLEHYHQMAEGDCAVDYGFHMMVNEVDGQTPKEMDMLVDEGVTSFKMFMAYPGRMYSDDAQLLLCYQKAGENGSLIQMHAENGIAIDVLRDQAVEKGQVDPVYHSLTRPALLEAEAVHRSVVLAEVAGCPLYIVHLSSANALQEVVAARDRGLNVFAETCPQYLFLDLTDLERPDFEGSKFVCSPPLRPSDHQAELWRGLATNDLQVIATDHCPFCWTQKELGRGDFRNIPNGIPGVEHRMELMYQGAVAEGRVSVNRWVDMCSRAPAQMFGLYPRKGTIAPGSDADIVVFNPQSPHVITAESHHMNVDYSCYEGHEVTGEVETVLLRGKVVVDGDEYLGRPGDGRYQSRDLCSGLI
ncbi:MAG: dihydropyrimidinase [Acidimicrobiaceae bacterium]|nr:dihydropyrimidinase [Acidimicrobiaceae bacterium]